jgi:hypothetical protein
MKNKFVIGLLTVVVVAAVAVTGAVYAQTPTPGTPAPGSGYGYRAQLGEDGVGLYHEEMLAAFSEALAIPVAELEARIDAGERLVQIALAEGLTIEEIQALKPVGMYMGGRGGARMGRGMGNPEGLHQNCDGSCIVDGEYVPQYLQNQKGNTRGSRGGR